MGFGLVIGFINNLQVVTTINYDSIADFHTTKHCTLSPLVFTVLQHRNYKSLTKSHTPNTTALQDTQSLQITR
jgi:hypothetical protein